VTATYFHVPTQRGGLLALLGAVLFASCGRRGRDAGLRAGRRNLVRIP